MRRWNKWAALCGAGFMAIQLVGCAPIDAIQSLLGSVLGAGG